MQQLLTECTLFKNMTSLDKEACLEQFQYQLKTYSKGEVVVYAQDAVVQLLVLLTGIVKNEMSDFNGKLITIAEMSGPKILAPGFLFGNQSHYPVSIFAKSDCKIMAIHKDLFQDTLLRNKQLQINFIDIISNQTQFLTRKINFLKMKTIKAKLAHFFLSMYSRQKKETLVLNQTQTQLADLFGVARPSLSRAIGELSQESIIRMEGKKIVLLNIEALQLLLV